MVEGQRFHPGNITVDVGGTVRFVNETSQAHTVTAYDNRIPTAAAYFSSGGFEDERRARRNLEAGLIDPGESYEVTFTVPGTYNYFCIPHEGAEMTGVVTVRD